MGDDKATAVPKEGVFAFFTTGDTRPSQFPDSAPPLAKLNCTQRYQKRAESLATAPRSKGVVSIHEATAALKALPKEEKLAKVFFVGHGLDAGFFFHGQQLGKDGFVSDNGDIEVLQGSLISTSKSFQDDFIQELIKHLHKTAPIEISFLSCFTGTGSTVSAVGRALDKAGFQDFLVGGYQNDYQTQYRYDNTNGAITEWTDVIFDRTNLKKQIGLRMRNGQRPKFETECGKSNDPLSLRLPC